MPKRRFNLEETWRLCLSMWRWIAKQIREGSEESVSDLKEEWLEKEGIEEIEEDCFFCEYGGGECGDCPGRLVDPDFHCANDEYYWVDSPILFCNELIRLNRKRKGK